MTFIFPTGAKTGEKSFSTGLLLCLLLASIPLAGQGQGPPSAQTKIADPKKVLSDSAWARAVPVQMPPYRTGIETSQSIIVFESGEGSPAEISRSRTDDRHTAIYLVRWESARSVREATGALLELGGHEEAAELGALRRAPADRYVVTVKMTHPPLNDPNYFNLADPFGRMNGVELIRRARLKTSRGSVGAIEVQQTGGGDYPATHFYFPRSLKDRDLLPESGETHKVEFRLKGDLYLVEAKFTLVVKELQ